jgi:hypothetical protein
VKIGGFGCCAPFKRGKDQILAQINTPSERLIQNTAFPSLSSIDPSSSPRRQPCLPKVHPPFHTIIARIYSRSLRNLSAIREYDAKLLLAYWLERAPPVDSSAKVVTNFTYPAPKVAQVSWDPETNTITPDAHLPAWVFSTKLVAKPDQLIKRRGKAGLLTLNKTWDEVKEWISARAGKPQQVSRYPLLFVLLRLYPGILVPVIGWDKAVTRPKHYNGVIDVTIRDLASRPALSDAYFDVSSWAVICEDNSPWLNVIKGGPRRKRAVVKRNRT